MKPTKTISATGDLEEEREIWEQATVLRTILPECPHVAELLRLRTILTQEEAKRMEKRSTRLLHRLYPVRQPPYIG